MCTQPNYFDGNEVACGSCNQCLSARRNDWVVRAMAEKAFVGHALLVNLTYRNDKNGQAPLGARGFLYSDVQKWFKSVREAYFRKYNARGEVSYLIAGEVGSKNDRVHYHCILFAPRPLDVLGKTTTPYGQKKEALIVNEGKDNERCIWSLWPHGHVVVQRPDEGGFQYVVKYINKDQFSHQKSKGTNREHNSENFASSKFNMSKVNPIGSRYLKALCDKWESEKRIPTSLNIKVPDYKGYWYPKGKLREYLLCRIHDITAQITKATGKKPLQFDALLGSLSVDNEKDMENLYYGHITQEKKEIAAEQGERSFSKYIGEQAAHSRRRSAINAAATKCGGILPCSECLCEWTEQEQESLAAEYKRQFKRYTGFIQKENPYEKPTFWEFEGYWLNFGRFSRGCKRKFDDETGKALLAKRSAYRFKRSIERGRSKDM